MAKLVGFMKWFVEEFYPKRKTGRACLLEEKILPRLGEYSVTLFTPWGPRYHWEERGVAIKEGDKEIATLRYLADIFSEINRRAENRTFRWVFLAADLYGTGINKLPDKMVGDYFASLSIWLKELIPESELVYWSAWQGEAEHYRRIVESLFSEFGEINPKLLDRAQATASKMESAGEALAYLKERAVEALLIEELLSPIKISCVERHKDDKVDLDLPRLYLLPPELTAPWM